jgi:hypothetical protein
MAYIGIQPAESFTSFATQTFSVSATTSYTLDSAVANENEIALFVNNVRQQPGSGKAYTATGTALTLSAATATTDTMYCIYLGRALQTVVPATNSITAAMIGDTAISGKTALAATPATTDELLISDAGTLKRIDAQFFQNTPAFLAYLGSNATVNDNTQTKVQCNTERYDTDSKYDNSTNYRFTPTVAGKYYLYGAVCYSGTDELYRTTVSIYVNGSAVHSVHGTNPYSGTNYGDGVFIGVAYDLDDDDYVELYTYVDTDDGSTAALKVTDTGVANGTYFGGFKIIG